MKRALEDRGVAPLYYLDINGKKVEGCPPGLIGNTTGLWGDASGLVGNIDLCELTDEERARGVYIRELVKMS